MLATVGAFLMGMGVLVFIGNVLWSRRRGALAGADPWGAGTLEWATTSPPPAYNFLHPPTVPGARTVVGEPAGLRPVVTGLDTEKRQVLVTTTLDAAPDHRYDLAGESIWPLLLALGVAGTLMIGGIFHPGAAPIGAGVIMLVLFGWFWTATMLKEKPSKAQARIVVRAGESVQRRTGAAPALPPVWIY